MAKPRTPEREAIFFLVEETRDRRYGPEADQALTDLEIWVKAPNGIERDPNGERSQEREKTRAYLVNIQACALAALEDLGFEE